MGYVHTLPASTCIVSSGDAGLRLARHHVENRMVPLIVLTDVTGRFHVIELTADDTVRLYEDLRVAFDADKRTVTQWWRALQTSSEALGYPPRAPHCCPKLAAAQHER
jgi:hypothetical protein